MLFGRPFFHKSSFGVKWQRATIKFIRIIELVTELLNIPN